MPIAASAASASSCATPRPRHCRPAGHHSGRDPGTTLLSFAGMDGPAVAPARLGRYELVARLAAGGMGEIFLARLEAAAGFEKLFVIKRVLPHLADEARFRGMLIAEARLASKMTHANICQVYELGETDGQLYIVMEYLEGVTLLPLLRKASRDGSKLELGFVAGVIQQVTDALHYAHELRDRDGSSLGIVHRDVTPTNLMLTDAGVVKVLDFGIAKVKDASAHTQTGTVKGKYAYMAPEQLRGAVIDRRADVFALGVVVYEMLALRRLFQRKTDYLTFRAVMEQPIIDIRRYRPDCPDALVAALGRALDRDPAIRFDTTRQFGTAILDAIAQAGRPWTQGEIGDFVRGNFADDIAARSAQIAEAVQTGAARQVIPLIANADDESTDIDDEGQEFPAVSSEVSETPVDVRHLREPSSERAAVDEPAELPGAPTPPAPVIVVSHKRSLVWPLVAFAMVAVAGGALFLVWQRIENQPPQFVIADQRAREMGANVITIEPNEPDAGTADPPPGGSDASGAGGSAGSASPEVRANVPHRSATGRSAAPRRRAPYVIVAP
ncbi:MAG: serine/threonine protein kinase [Deltaproteobacteria bacterium]|nr:MAG: serine/threonine protein kinase [Deltaproteobacteria bacterium]